METEVRGLESVKEYYGRVLKSNKDLKTNACCTADSMPIHLREILKDIHEEVKEKFYGCGSPIPTALHGKTVLDLGSGSGRDCFLLSKLVGPSGKVIGIDMTDEQLQVARRHIDHHTKKFGYSKSNVEFVSGYIEDLESAGIRSESIDVVTSNCVVNLSPAKRRVFSEVFRVLKPGGELYFSDVFSSRRIPAHIASDEVMLGECLGGALYIEDFRRLLCELGCRDFRTTSKTKIHLNNHELQEKAGLIEFYSMTIRAFKLDLEDRCEDYGQIATYLGTIKESPKAFFLDDHHLFEKGRPVAVCGNTAMMLKSTRYGAHFKIDGDMSHHYGLFDCVPATTTIGNSAPTCC